MLLVWLAGGLLSLLGALCFAELATTYPHAGGNYEYLRRAFGGGTAFLFVWARMTVIQTGSMALLADGLHMASHAVALGIRPSGLTPADRSSDTTLPVEIFHSMEFDFDAAILALSSMIVAGSVVLLWMIQKLVGLDVLVRSTGRG